MLDISKKKEKMKEKGILSVEASIVLTVTILFMLFICDFGYVFRAQNYAIHSIIQTGEGLSFLTYKYKIEEDESVLELVKSILTLFGYESDNTLIRTYTRNEEYASALKQYMLSNITTKEELERYGIDSAGMDFSKSEVVNNDLKIVVEYQVKVPFSVFGLDKITLKQQILAGLWK